MTSRSNGVAYVSFKEGTGWVAVGGSIRKIVTDLWVQPHAPKQAVGEQCWCKHSLVVGSGARSPYWFWGDAHATFSYSGAALATA